MYPLYHKIIYIFFSLHFINYKKTLPKLFSKQFNNKKEPFYVKLDGSYIFWSFFFVNFNLKNLVL